MRTIPVFLDQDRADPLYEQICQQVRSAVLNGTLHPGDPLPSSREWAVSLGTSRTTVLTALDQLRSEGYLESRRGGEVRISSGLPENLAVANKAVRRRRVSKVPIWTNPGNHGVPVPFQIAVPAIDSFPCREWGRIAANLWKKPALELLNYPQPGGHPPLRRAIADYLREERGVVCDPEQVIITAGSQQALSLAARTLLKPGDRVGIENPGYYAARLAFERAGGLVETVPVDEDGLRVQNGMNASLLYVTPSSQCPTGARLSLDRRLRLLRWAEQAKAYVIEDEYDSGFRFIGRPLAPLHSLDKAGRVLYVGSFSLLLYPSLRIGFLVAPPLLVDAFLSARALEDWNSSAMDQAILTEFLDRGLLGRHLRRMRVLYAERREVLLSEGRRKLGRWVQFEERPEGLHVMGYLEGISEEKMLAAASQAGVKLRPLSMYIVGEVARPAVLFGFAPFAPEAIRSGIAALRRGIMS